MTLRAMFVVLCRVEVEEDCTDGRAGKSSAELRALWKKAMLETLLLIRMEKENSDIKGMGVTHLLFLCCVKKVILISFFSSFLEGKNCCRNCY